jgi:hypothetical protein
VHGILNRRAPSLSRPSPYLVASLIMSCLLVADARARPVPLPDVGQDSVELESAWLVVLWADGEVVWRPEERRDARPTSLAIGERLGPGTIVVAQAGARAIVLSGGDQIATITGPGRWLLETGRITSLVWPTTPPIDPPMRSPRARLDRLLGYREGPMPMLEPLSSQPMFYDDPLPMTLAITQPSAPVSRSRPEVRWHWPFDGGRFDLLIEETDASGSEVVRVVERWRNLEGRSHVPMSELIEGSTYRLTVSLTSTRRATDGGSPILDRRLLHILAPSEASAVDGALTSLDALQGQARRFRPELDVLRARLLESHGLWDEAEAIWTGLAILYPGNNDVLSHAMRLHSRSVQR